MTTRGGQERPRGGGTQGRRPDTATVRVPVPVRVEAAWKGFSPQDGTHPAYWLARMVPWMPEKNGPPGRAGAPLQSRAWPRGARAAKDDALRSTQDAINTKIRFDLAAQVLARRRAWLLARERAGTARRLHLTARTEAVLWLASAGPLEVSLALHHLYGVPILPGSALKGLARRVARLTAGDSAASARYGAQEDSGPVAFLDGLPSAGWTVQRDVMTPHYGKWYRGEGLPDDTESPVPIGFLSIGPGSCFEAALVARNDAGARHLDGIVEDLRRGLDELGLGAKTAAGYGVFALEVAPPGAAEAVPPGREERATAAKARESAEAAAVRSQISSLRRHEVSGRLAALAASIERCAQSEREALVAVLRSRLQQLGFKAREIQGFEQRYPILRRSAP